MTDIYAVKNGYARVIGDAMNAFFHVPRKEKVVCSIPDELKPYLGVAADHTTTVMLLKKRLYGQRDASVGYEEFVCSELVRATK